MSFFGLLKYSDYLIDNIYGLYSIFLKFSEYRWALSLKDNSKLPKNINKKSKKA